MFRRIYIFILFASSLSALSAQRLQKIFIPEGDAVTELRWDGGSLIGDFAVPEVGIVKNAYDYFELIVPSYIKSGKPGAPSILSKSEFVELDFDCNYQLSLKVQDSILLDLSSYFADFQLMPIQPSRKRRGSIDGQFTEPNPNIYNENKWYALPIVDLFQEGNLRGVQLGRLVISPFKYNPHTKQLLIYTNIQFELKPSVLRPVQEKSILGTSFSGVFGDVLMKDRVSEKKKLLKEEPISMIVLSDSIFAKSLEPYLRWKAEKGIKVIEVYVDELGLQRNFEAIKDSLRSVYENPPEGFDVPSYLTIVGESSIVPLSSSWDNEVYTTDLYYTTFDEPVYVYDSLFADSVYIDTVVVDSISDYLPEMFYGRISVKNSGELDVVLNKIIQYETYGMSDAEYLGRTVLAAGSDGYASLYGNGQLQYATDHYLNEEHGIGALAYNYPNSSDDFLDMRNEISQGVGFVNYTGHGSPGGWIESSGTVTFGVDHLAEMPSNDKYAMYVVNACLTNNFRYSSDCIGEALLKEKGKGAVGYIGATYDSYWDEDFYWAVGVGASISHINYDSTTNGFYDKVFHDRGEAVEIWTPSMGEMIFGGNMAVMGSDSDLKRYYWELYQLMGDPSVVPWFAEAEPNDIELPATLAEGSTSINIQANALDYCAISYDGVLLDARHADEQGFVELNFPDTLNNEQLMVVVSSDRYRPFIRMIPDSGYLHLLDFSYTNESVVKDSLLSNGEKFSFGLKLENLGSGETGPFDLELKADAAGLSVVDSTLHVESIQPGSIAEIECAFLVAISGDAIDMTVVKFSMQRLQDKIYNTLIVKDTIHAPVLLSGGLSWNDQLGKPDGIAEAGERLTLLWDVMNVGSYSSDSLEVWIDTHSRDSILTSPLFPDASVLSAGERRIISFQQSLIDDTLLTAQFAGPFVYGDSNFYIRDSLWLRPEVFSLDFSNNRSNLLAWQEQEWFETEDVYYSYSAALRSGLVGNNDTSSMSLDIYMSEVDSMSFVYQVSSEEDYDYFHFYTDTSEILKVSGYTEWEKCSFELDTGWNHLQWTYIKDESVSRGMDAAYIDNVVFPVSGYRSNDLAIQGFASPLRSAFLGDSEGFNIKLWNFGQNVIDSFDIVFQLDTISWQKQHFKQTIQTDSSLLLFVNAGLDLSELRTYKLRIGVFTDGDVYYGNDSLEMEIVHYPYPDLAIFELGFDSVSAQYCDIVIKLENTGNIDMNKWEFELKLDDVSQGNIAYDIELSPLETDTISIPLLSVDDDILPGLHSYELRSAPDSLLSNNVVSGEVYWHIVSVEEGDFPNLQIYPNPFKDHFTLQLSDEIDLPCKLNIYSISGHQMYTGELFESRSSLYASELFGSEGIYVLQIVAGNYRYECKIEMLK